MEEPVACRLNGLSVLDVVGADAATIVNNLTTQEVARLSEGEGCETFVTDTRGKIIGHLLVFRQSGQLRMIGAGDQSQSVAAHLDRYTIREDAEPQIRDDEFSAIVLPPSAVAKLSLDADGPMPLRVVPAEALAREIEGAYSCPWLGETSLIVLARREMTDGVVEALRSRAVRVDTKAATFHQLRTWAGFPWFGIDIDTANLPQEADRNGQAISFTKGCYLGQETVARLDALGQVQKKLVRWSIRGAVPASGATVMSGDKTVARLTSVAAGGRDDAIAIAMTRRSHFESGSQGIGTDPQTGESFEAQVI